MVSVKNKFWLLLLIVLIVLLLKSGFNSTNKKRIFQTTGPAHQTNVLLEKSRNISKIYDKVQRDHLLVVVIAGGEKEVYFLQRGFWRLIRQNVAKLGIYIYLTARDTSISEPVVSYDTIVFPGEDSLIPGILQHTLESFRYIKDHKLPGYQSRHILRTNLSSFWSFNKLLQWLANKPDEGFVSAQIPAKTGDGIQFPSGAGFIISQDRLDQILASKDRLDFNRPDDVAIGGFLNANNYTIEEMVRCDTFTNQLITFPIEYNEDCYHWRVKTEIPYLPLQDVAVWSNLYMLTYGPSMTIL
jgi:hypothetical protein